MLPIARKTKALIEHSMEHFTAGSESDLQFALLHADNSVEIMLKYYLRFTKNMAPAKVDEFNFFQLVSNSKDLKIISESHSYFLVYHGMRNMVWHDGLMIPPKSDVDSATNYAKKLFNELFPDFGFSEVHTSVPSQESISSLQNNYGNKAYLSEISKLKNIIEIFTENGYQVIENHNQYDYGFDVIAKKDSYFILCEIKSGRSRIGSHIIHGLNNSFTNYINDRGIQRVEKWFITDAPLVSNAVVLSKKFNIKMLKNREIEKELQFLTNKYSKNNPIKELYQNFLKINNFEAGEGLVEPNLDAWMKDRRNAKAHYQMIFNKDNIGDMKKEDFEGFLYFRNNRSWTYLYRRGLVLVDNFEEVRKTLIHLQNYELPIQQRLRDVFRGGKYHINGFGKNTITGILHIIDDLDRYGVWNSVTEKGLEALGRKPKISTSNLSGSYLRVNKELLKLKEELNTDLVMIDAFMWYLTKYHSDKEK